MRGFIEGELGLNDGVEGGPIAAPAAMVPSCLLRLDICGDVGSDTPERRGTSRSEGVSPELCRRQEPLMMKVCVSLQRRRGWDKTTEDRTNQGAMVVSNVVG